MSVLLRPFADSSFDDPPPWEPRPAPSGLDMWREQVVRRLMAPLEMLQETGRWLRSLPTDFEEIQARLAENATATWDFISAGLRPPAETPLNKPIGPYRRFDWNGLDLDAVKSVKNRLGGTVNDVVLACVAGALRRYLLRKGCNLDALDYKTVVPVSIRSAEELGSLGNRVAAWMLSLPIQESDPILRYSQVCQVTTHIKDTKQARGVGMLSQVAELVDPIMTLGIRLASRLHPYNLIISNVPGPQFPLYLLGSRLLSGYPTVPLFEYQGLGIATFSYDGKLFWGLNADWDLVPDLHEIALDLVTSFEELRSATAHASEATDSSALSTRRRRNASEGRKTQRRQHSS